MNFNWKNSPAHINLLRSFIKPHDVAPFIGRKYLQESLNEDPKDAIERFIQDGVLIPGEIEETLSSIFTAAKLRKMLKERGLKQSGDKEELVERLLAADHLGMKNTIERFKIMKCSPDALALIQLFEKEYEQERESALQLVHSALMRDDSREAYKIYVSFNRKYIDPYYKSTPYKVTQLESILSSYPKVLGKMSSFALKSLQAAVCMGKLYGDYESLKWLPEGFTTHLKSNRIAINYLTRHAEFRSAIAAYGEYVKKVKILFNENDVDSCDLCLALKGKEFDKDNLPELPFENCSSETGCMCELRPVYGHNHGIGLTYAVKIGSNGDGDENDGFEREDPLFKLKQLKQMLDGGLITEAEYDAKKAEILSRI